MKTKTVEVFTINELSEEAREAAHIEYMPDYGWFYEDKESLEAFADKYRVKIKDYSIDCYYPSWIKTNATNEDFRGKKPKDIDVDDMPTGYHLDCVLSEAMKDYAEKNGDMLGAFNHALDVAVKQIELDIEHCYSMDYFVEHCEANDYEFTADGRMA